MRRTPGRTPAPSWRGEGRVAGVDGFSGACACSLVLADGGKRQAPIAGNPPETLVIAQPPGEGNGRGTAGENGGAAGVPAGTRRPPAS